jgi:hypothetical protein
MSEDKALIPVDATNQLQKWTDEDFQKVVTSGSYLPRLQLMTANSEPCKTGEFPINHYALVRDKVYQDLGLTVDILLIAWRPKSLDMGGEIVIAEYNPESDPFKAIVEKAEIKDSGCMYGPEYLVWIPSTKSFALFFMGSKSARRESPNLNSRLLKASTLKSKKIETTSYTWYCPQVTPCRTPFEIPDQEDVKEQVQKFNNPPQQEIQKVEDGAPARDR